MAPGCAKDIVLWIQTRFPKVVFPDAICVAVDSGPDIVNRKAARSGGRNAAERNALIIDRFFQTKQKALAWAKAHPHFMTVQILTLADERHAGPVAVGEFQAW